MNWDHMRGWDHMGGWGMFGMVLFWILVIVGIVVLVRYLVDQGSSRSAQPRQETAMEVLKKRYARGELSKEEYEKMKKDLAA